MGRGQEGCVRIRGSCNILTQMEHLQRGSVRIIFLACRNHDVKLRGNLCQRISSNIVLDLKN